MIERQNITLSLPRALLKKAKVVAAQKEKSLTELMREALEERVNQDSRYQKARQRHTRVLKAGFDLGTKGRYGVNRDDLHARR